MDGQPSLIIALEEGDTESAIVMIKHNSCIVNERDQYGQTALHKSCYGIYKRRSQNKNKYLPIFYELINNESCDVNARDGSGRSALMVACVYELTGCVDTLLSHPHCKLDIRDNNGETALHYLLDNSKAVETTENILRQMVAHKEFDLCASMLSNSGFSALDMFLTNDKYFSPDFKVSPAAERLLSLLFQSYMYFHSSKRTFALAVRFTGLDMCERVAALGFNCNSFLPEDETAAHCAVQLNDSEKLKIVTQHSDVHLLETKWRGSNVYAFAKILNRGDSISSSFPSKVPFSSKTDPQYQRIQVSDSNESMVLSEHNITSTMNLSNKVTSNPKSAFRVIKFTTLSNRTTADDCDKIGKLSLKLALRISNQFSKHDKYAFLQFEPELSGSIHERTKCYFPNECDVVCRFMHCDSLKPWYDADKHQVSFSASVGSAWVNMLNNEGEVIISQLNRTFYSAVDFVIQHGDLNYDVEEDSCILSLNEYSLHYENKISRLVAYFSGPHFKELPVSIDLVPAIVCNDYIPSKPLPLGLHCPVFLALAKAPRYDYSNDKILFPVTYSHAEALLMKTLANHIREGYITAKSLRLASICQPGLSKNDLELSLSDNIDIEKFITSYRLKNALFNILKKKEGQPNSRCRFEWADAIYAELQQSLGIERGDRLWYDEKLDLLNCHCHTDTYICCSKRKLILALTYEIRYWLAANIIQLKLA